MNVHDTDPQPSDSAAPLPTDGPDAATPADKPKRRRAPRKLAAEGEAGETAGSDGPVVLSAPSLASLFHGAPGRPHLAEPVATAAPQIEPAAASAQAPAAEPARAAGDGVASAGTEAAGDTGAGQDGASSERPAGARRGRNRRRGRRGAERAGGVDQGPNDDDSDRTIADGQDADDPADDVDSGRAAPSVVDQAPRPPPVEVGEVFAEVLSGAYDAEPVLEELAELPSKRVLLPEPDAPKLHKVLAQSGVGSRRDLEQMIVDKRVTVNDEVAHTGQRISFGDRIAIDGKPVRFRIAPPAPRVLAYHKPVGEVVSHDDPQQRPTVFRRLPRLQQGKWQSVGRLDINTEGLLLFTNSGELANQLMHPRFGVEREYAVRSLGVLDAPAKARLLEGVEIDGQRAAFKSIGDGGGEGVNHWYRVVITEGRNREVRRLFEAVGHAVSRLIRIRYGSVVLPRGLKRGVWVDLDDHDMRALRSLAQGPRTERDPAQRSEGPDSVRDGRDGRPGRKGRDGRDGRNGRNEQRPRPPGDAPEAATADRGPTPERGERPPRPPRPERPERAPRPPRGEPGERGDFGPIPNPLQQTFDRSAIQQDRALRRDMSEDGPIPNPLQQTYDKRALQHDRAPRREIPDDGPIPNPLQQTYDKRGIQGGPRNKGDFGNPNRQQDPQPGGGGGGGGYIGGDAFLRKGSGGRGARSGGRGPGGGGGGGGGGNRGGGSGGGNGNRGGGGRGGPGR